MNKQENSQIKEALNSFMTSYAQRDTSVVFSEWLGFKLQQAMPGMSDEASKKLTAEIISGVSEYNNTLTRNE